MWDNYKRKESKFVFVTGFLNEMHLTSVVFVAVFLVFAVVSDTRYCMTTCSTTIFITQNLK